VVLTAVCVIVPVLLPKQTPVSALPLPALSGGANAAAEELSPSVQEVQKAIALSLSSPTWPEQMSPSLNDPNAGMSPEMASADCLNPVDASDPNICTSGAGDKTAVVVGDSVAASWAPTIRAALAGKGYAFHTVTFSGCPYIQAEIGIPDKPAPSQKCNEARPLINQQIAELRPDLVFISSAVKDFSSLQSGKRAEAAIPEWTAGTVASIKLAKEAGARVVLIAPNPEGKSVESCATRTSAPSDCASGVPDLWFPKAQAEEAAAKSAGALFVDPRTWMCSPDDVCPMFIKEHLVRWDNTHLTEPFATSLGPLLLESISPLLAE
jgi:hypothetical protein